MNCSHSLLKCPTSSLEIIIVKTAGLIPNFFALHCILFNCFSITLPWCGNSVRADEEFMLVKLGHISSDTKIVRSGTGLL